MISVLLEASVIGIAEVKSGESRSGIYTYVANLALALQRIEGVRVLPVCSSPLYLKETQQAVRALGLDCEVLDLQLQGLLLGPWMPGLYSRLSANSLRAAGASVAVRLAAKSIRLLLLPALWLFHIGLPLALVSSRLLRVSQGQCLLHDPHWTSSWYGVLKRLRLTKLRRCVTLHDLLPLLHPEFFDRNINVKFRWFLSSLLPSDRLIAVSANTADDFCRVRPIACQQVLAVTHLAAAPGFDLGLDPGLDPRLDLTEEVETLLSSFGLTSGHYMMSLCTLEPRKNIGRLLEAFADVVRAGSAPDCLLLVGQLGWKMKRLEAVIAELGVQDRVVLSGYLPDQHLPLLLRHCAFFVYPSLYEGFGLPVVEAMACGCAVITSASSSMQELFAEAAVLVDPLDPASIAAAMRALHQDRQLVTRLRQQSRARAARFSWSATATATLDAYRRCLGGA